MSEGGGGQLGMPEEALELVHVLHAFFHQLQALAGAAVPWNSAHRRHGDTIHYQTLSYNGGRKHTVAMGAGRLSFHRRTVFCV